MNISSILQTNNQLFLNMTNPITNSDSGRNMKQAKVIDIQRNHSLGKGAVPMPTSEDLIIECLRKSLQDIDDILNHYKSDDWSVAEPRT